MAGYLSPGAYFYAEEQEYLQAYEDVLERYKGRAAGRCRAAVRAAPPGGSGRRGRGAPAPRSAAVGRKVMMTGADGFSFLFAVLHFPL